MKLIIPHPEERRSSVSKDKATGRASGFETRVSRAGETTK